MPVRLVFLFVFLVYTIVPTHSYAQKPDFQFSLGSMFVGMTAASIAMASHISVHPELYYFTQDFLNPSHSVKFTLDLYKHWAGPAAVSEMAALTPPILFLYANNVYRRIRLAAPQFKKEAWKRTGAEARNFLKALSKLDFVIPSVVLTTYLGAKLVADPIMSTINTTPPEGLLMTIKDAGIVAGMFLGPFSGIPLSAYFYDTRDAAERQLYYKGEKAGYFRTLLKTARLIGGDCKNALARIGGGPSAEKVH